MATYYIDRDSKYKYLYLQEELILAYEEALKENKMTRQKFNKCISENPAVHLGEEAVRKHMTGKTAPKNIADVMAYGEVLKNNPKAFLVLSETEDPLFNELKEVMEHATYPENCVVAAKANLMKIFSEYAASDCFNRVEKQPEVLAYYRKKIDKVEHMVMRIFNRPLLKEALFGFINDLRRFICAGEIPGIPQPWFGINPNLRFYAAGFEFIEKYPENYESLKKGKLGVRLDYYPSPEELEEKIRYFEEMDRYFRRKRSKSEEQNFWYTDIDFYEKELINTIDTYFETTVSMILNSGM